MASNLDLATLRSFTLIAQGRSFAQTAAAIGRSQSAVSLQIQKLEADVGTRLFRRSRSEGVDLTVNGERFLAYARRIVQLNDEAVGSMNIKTARAVSFGVTPDIAETVLARIIDRFGQEHPSTELMLRIDGSKNLVEAVNQGELDLAIALNLDNPLNQGRVAEGQMLWIARPDFGRPESKPLPLALFEAPCSFRIAALDALGSGIPYRITASSSSIGGIIAAVRSGLCVTVRTRHLLTGELANVGEKLNLPALPSATISFYARSGQKQAERDDLVEICRQYLR